MAARLATRALGVRLASCAAMICVALALLGSADAAGQPLGAQVRVSQMGPDGNADFDAVSPAVAYNSQANQSLVVWDGDDTTDGENEIFGRLLDAGGIPIGPVFRISAMGPDGDANFEAFNAAVAYNAQANEYLVVWHADDNTPPLVNGEDEIYGQRLDAAGGAIGADDFRISAMGPDGNATLDGFNAAVAYNAQANEFLVTWEGEDDTPPLANNEREIFGQRLDAAGGAIGADDFRISAMGPDGNTSFGASSPAVAYNAQANEYLATWDGDDDTPPLVDNEREIFGQRLDAAGGEIAPDDFRISAMGPDGNASFGADDPAVAYNATASEYLVTWEGDDNTPPLVDNETEIFGQRLNAAGGELAPDDFQISTMGPDGNTLFEAERPAIAYNARADEFLVAWDGEDDTPPLANSEDEIFGQRLNAAAGEVGPDDFRISAMGPDGDANFIARSPAIAYNPPANEYLVAWSGDDNTPPLVDEEGEIFARRAEAGLIAGRCANPRFGSPAADTLVGTPAGDNILGLAGDDTLSGAAGDDCLDGGDGRDTLDGGAGNDDLKGVAGNDRKLTGGAGNDALDGGTGNDSLSGDADKDSLDGGTGNDRLKGGDGNDTLKGGKGHDSLAGGRGKNSYSGGSGNDKINARNKRKETVDCGKGRKDSAKVDRNDRVKGCERVRRAR